MCVPLLFWRETGEVFEFNKVLLLRATALLLGTLGLATAAGHVVRVADGQPPDATDCSTRSASSPAACA